MQKEDGQFRFSWDLIGDVDRERPNLGSSINIEIYRLMQLTMIDIIEQYVGAEKTEKIIYGAGELAGKQLYENKMKRSDNINDFIKQLQKKFQEEKTGILRVEIADMKKGHVVVTVTEDINCSTLSELENGTYTYEEGFIAGLLESFSGQKFKISEIDCWGTENKTCRFEAVVDVSKRKASIESKESLILQFVKELMVNKDATGEIPEELKNIEDISELEMIASNIMDLREGIHSISSGKLGDKLKGTGYLLGAVKSLQAGLRHVVWQTNMIAEEDYYQEIDYFGDLSKSFNNMIKELRKKIEEIKEEEAKVNIAVEKLEETYMPIRKSEKRHRLIADNATDVIWTADKDLNLSYVSPSIKRLLGYTPIELKEMSSGMAMKQSELNEIKKAAVEKTKRYKNGELNGTNADSYIVKQMKKDGSIIYTETSMSRIFNEENEYLELLGVTRDVTSRVNMEKSLIESEEKINLIFENSPVGIISYNSEADIITVNSKVEKILGISRQEMIGEDIHYALKGDFDECIDRSLNGEAANFEEYIQNERLNKKIVVRASFVPLVRENNTLDGGVAIVEDFTERKEMEYKIKKLSETDNLTQLNNRMKIDEIFEEESKKATKTGEKFSIIVLDIDFFKKVNDKYGHLVGDIVLKEIAELLKTSIRGADSIGRWGGEEFLIIAPETELEDAGMLAEKIRVKVESNRFTISDRITCSFGVSEWEENSNSAVIFSRADRALYKAKNSGRNKVMIFKKT